MSLRTGRVASSGSWVAAGVGRAASRVAGCARIAAAPIAGAALALAFPPYDLWPLAFGAVAALSVLTRGRTMARGAAIGFGFGLGFFVVLLDWLRVVGWDAVLAAAALEALFLIPVGTAFALTSARRGWPIWQAAIWVAGEALRAREPFGGLPWGRLAFAQADSPLSRLASLGGMPLVSLAVAAVGLFGLAAVHAAAATPRRGLLPLGAAAGVFGIASLTSPAAGGPDHVTVAIVQGNVPRAGYDTAVQQRVVFANHVEATHALATAIRDGRAPRPDFVIWPENSADSDPFGHLSVAFSIDAAVDDVGAPTLVGAVLDAGPDHVRNAGIVWTPGRGAGQFYTKRHPVPFGEYLPMRRLLTKLISRFGRVPRDFEPGHRPGVLDVGPTRIGEVICFEIAYDDLVRDVVRGGGRVLVVQTNNATYGRTGQPEQQLAITRLRAIEQGRAVVVAATSGISAVVAPDGTVRHRTREFTREVTVSQIPLHGRLTLATRLGGWPEAAICVPALVGIAASRPARPGSRAAATVANRGIETE